MANVSSSIKADVLSFCWCGAFSCVSTTPKRKDVCNDLTEAVAAACKSGKSYKAIFKQSEIHHSTVKKFIHKGKTFKTAVSLPICGLPANSHQPVQCSEKLNVRVMTLQLEKGWTSMSCLVGLPGERFFFLKGT